MQLLTQINHINEVSDFLKLGINELIIAPKEISRFGILNHLEAELIILELKKYNIKMYLQADLLVPEYKFKQYIEEIEKFDLKNISAIRICDIGVANYFKTKNTNKIHLILETGFHNFESVYNIYNEFKNVCVRLVLSGEVPSNNLFEWIPKILVDVEILGFGPILIFYSKRFLLSPVTDNNSMYRNFNNEIASLVSLPRNDNNGTITQLQSLRGGFALKQSNFINAEISSNEFKIKSDFKIIQNDHGTFIFYAKHLSLLKYIKELEFNKISTFRIDRNFLSDFKLFFKINSLLENFNKDLIDNIHSEYNYPVINGFYNSNKTMQTFNKLKNTILDIRGKNLKAIAIEATKDKYIVLQVIQSLKVGQKVYFITPLGKRIDCTLKKIKTLSSQEIEIADKNSICYTAYIDGVTTQSFLYI